MYRPRFSIRILLAAATAAALLALVLRYPQQWLPPVLVAVHVLLTVVAAVGAIATSGARRVFFASWALCAAVWSWTFFDTRGIVPVAWELSGDQVSQAITATKSDSSIMQHLARRLTEFMPTPRLRPGAPVLAPMTSGAFDPNATPRVIDAKDLEAAEVGVFAGGGLMYTRVAGVEDGRFRLANNVHLFDAAALKPVHDTETIERTLKASLGPLFAWLGAVVLWMLFGRTADAAAKGATTP